MSDHDPMCSAEQYADVVPADERQRVIDLMCRCALIARVREDERGKDELIVANAWNAGWQQGLSAARGVVAATPHHDLCSIKRNYPCNCLRGRQLAAIDALRGDT